MMGKVLKCILSILMCSCVVHTLKAQSDTIISNKIFYYDSSVTVCENSNWEDLLKIDTENCYVTKQLFTNVKNVYYEENRYRYFPPHRLYSKGYVIHVMDKQKILFITYKKYSLTHPVGLWKYYYPNGQLKSQVRYALKKSHHYSYNEEVGDWIYYNEQGKRINKVSSR